MKAAAAGQRPCGACGGRRRETGEVSFSETTRPEKRASTPPAIGTVRTGQQGSRQGVLETNTDC